MSYYEYKLLSFIIIFISNSKNIIIEFLLGYNKETNNLRENIHLFHVL